MQVIGNVEVMQHCK